MNITILNPMSEFSSDQRARLQKLGVVNFVEKRQEYPLKKLISLTKDADILAIDPDIVGGFEKAKRIVNAVLQSSPRVKAIALSTTSEGWIDHEYLKQRQIVLTNIPNYSRESIAEHTIALLLCASKKILITDRRTERNQYHLDMGFELYGKTLGVIGLGSIGSRVAELALSLGMKVIAYNRSPRTIPRVEILPLKEVLRRSDALTLHLAHVDELKGFISTLEFQEMKKGSIMINTADRTLVDEFAMATAIKEGKILSYIYEAEDIENSPLRPIEEAICLKGFGWYTQEALQRLFETWTENILVLSLSHSTS